MSSANSHPVFLTGASSTFWSERPRLCFPTSVGKSSSFRVPFPPAALLQLFCPVAVAGPTPSPAWAACQACKAAADWRRSPPDERGSRRGADPQPPRPGSAGSAPGLSRERSVPSLPRPGTERLRPPRLWALRSLWEALTGETAGGRSELAQTLKYVGFTSSRLKLCCC